MLNPSKTILVFGIYMLSEGLILLLLPNLLLSIVGIPETTEVWVRLAGFALIVLGYYYIQAARHNLLQFFQWTVHMRFLQFFVTVALVIFKLGPAVIIMFSAMEFASGIWTWLALKKSKESTVLNNSKPNSH